VTTTGTLPATSPFRILLEQGGNFYTASVDSIAPNGSFQAVSGSDLTASDFSQICLITCGPGAFGNPGNLGPDTPVALNFVNGGAITFGILYEASPGLGVTSTTTYDDLDIDISTTPLPATLPLFAGGLGVIGFLRRRSKSNTCSALDAT